MTSIGADHLEATETPIHEVGEKGPPFSSTLRLRETEVDDLLLAVMTNTQGDKTVL